MQTTLTYGHHLLGTGFPEKTAPGDNGVDLYHGVIDTNYLNRLQHDFYIFLLK